MRMACCVCSLVIAAAAGCDGGARMSSAGAPVGIVGGEIDSEHGAVLATYADAGPFCSAALIDRRLVALTPNCAPASGGFYALFGPDAFSPDATIAIEQVLVHPDYSPDDLNSPFVAVGVLAEDAPESAAPLPILPEGLGLGAGDVGSDLTFVGYGSVSASTEADGLRRWVDAPIATVADGQFTADISEGGPCMGDSPALIQRDATEYLAGLVVYGDEMCEVSAGGVDLSAFHEFLDGVIEEYGTGAPDGGADTDADGGADADADADTDADGDGGAGADDGGTDGAGDSGCGCRAAAGAAERNGSMLAAIL